MIERQGSDPFTFLRGELSGWNLEVVAQGATDEIKNDISTLGIGATLGVSLGGKI